MQNGNLPYYIAGDSDYNSQEKITLKLHFDQRFSYNTE